MGAFKRQLASA